MPIQAIGRREHVVPNVIDLSLLFGLQADDGGKVHWAAADGAERDKAKKMLHIPLAWRRPRKFILRPKRFDQARELLARSFARVQRTCRFRLLSRGF